MITWKQILIFRSFFDNNQIIKHDINIITQVFDLRIYITLHLSIYCSLLLNNAVEVLTEQTFVTIIRSIFFRQRGYTEQMPQKRYKNKIKKCKMFQ